jgi:AcrR family transcriptional regulator
VTRKARTDAEHNRRHIVTVARAAFAADGLELPIREIARRAGLGVATVYRHFPARPELIAAVLADQVAACEAELRAALDDPDPWRALGVIVRRFGERQVQDRGLNEALLGSHAAGDAFAEQRRAHAEGLELIVERARAAGRLRPGLSVQDVRIGLRAIASFRGLPPEGATAAIRRLTDLLLAGLAHPEAA